MKPQQEPRTENPTKKRVARLGLVKDLDLSPYAGRWVAIVRGCVTGVGLSAEEARLASKHQRIKEEPQVIFVSETIAKEE